MRSNLKKSIKKWTAAALSAALVFSMSPVNVSRVAEAEETEQAEAEETMRNVCFGVADGLSVSDATNVVFSISRFDKGQSVSSDAAKVAEVQASQNSWVLTEKATEDSLDAHINDTNVEKITAVTGYGDYSGYDNKVIRIKHKSGTSVLSDATQISAVIADSNNNVIYYGMLNDDAGSSLSDFVLPKGLTQGKYELYVFAENVQSWTDTGFKATAKDKVSDIGEPIEIEVLDSLKFNVCLDWPEFDSEPDTTADIYIYRDNQYSETISGSAIEWSKSSSSNEEIDVFEFNREYTANISLQIKEELYMSENVKAFFGNNKQAEIYYSGSGNLEISYTFDKIKVEKIIIGGEVQDGDIILNAYFDTLKPVKVDASKYECKWYIGETDGSLNDANCNSSEYKLVSSEYNSYIKVEVSIEEFEPDAIVTSSPVKVTNGELKVDFLVGVNKSDETYKAKADGVISGLKSDMSCMHVDGSEKLYPNENGVVSNLAAGEYKVSIDTSDLQTADTISEEPDATSTADLGMETEVNEVSAEYEIATGRTINVGFDSNGGSGVSAITGLSYGDKISKPEEPAREGYTFKGWYKDWQFTTVWDFDNDTVESDITLHAKWERNTGSNTGNTGDTDNSNTGNTGDTDSSNTGNTGGEDDNNTGDTDSSAGNTEGNGSSGNSGTSGGTATYPIGSGGVSGGASQSGTSTTAPSSAPSAAPSSAPTETPDSISDEDTTTVSKDDNQLETSDVELPNDYNVDISNDELPEPAKEGEKVVVEGTEYKFNGDNTVALSGQDIGSSNQITISGTVEIDGKTYTVTKISSNAFSGSNIESVSIDDNIKTIGTSAFKNCKKLKKVSLPSSLTTIGKTAFKNCTNLTTVTIPSNVKKLGVGSFRNCTKLSKAVLPSSIKTIGKRAYKNCTSLSTFKLGKVVNSASLNKNGFKQGTEVLLKGTDNDGIRLFGAVPSTKVSIGASALENCVNLRSVIINSQVTKIGNSTFQNCVKLASILVKSLKLKTVGKKSLKGVNNCKISVPSSKFKPYSTLFKNKGQGKKVVIAKS